jgi:hypothetical protein
MPTAAFGIVHQTNSRQTAHLQVLVPDPFGQNMLYISGNQKLLPSTPVQGTIWGIH